METWYGRREGTEGAMKKYGADKAFSIEKFSAGTGENGQRSRKTLLPFRR
jgi:hypothetical protein